MWKEAEVEEQRRGKPPDACDSSGGIGSGGYLDRSLSVSAHDKTNSSSTAASFASSSSASVPKKPEFMVPGGHGCCVLLVLLAGQ